MEEADRRTRRRWRVGDGKASEGGEEENEEEADRRTGRRRRGGDGEASEAGTESIMPSCLPRSAYPRRRISQRPFGNWISNEEEVIKQIRKPSKKTTKGQKNT
jgi:hypothetical protein